MRFGFPGLDNVKTFDDYVLSYDRKTRTGNLTNYDTVLSLLLL